MSTVKRELYDVNQPGATALRNKIVHGAFMTEGQMVAFPLCFPSVSIPIRADESKITVLDVTEDGVVYGGTEGYAAHLFVGMFHGVTGMVFDMGVVDGCTTTAAMCCGEEKIFAAANGPDGSRAIVRDLQPTPFSLIQEWGINRLPYTYLDLPGSMGRILHAVSVADRSRVVGIAEHAVFTYDFASGSFDLVDSFEGGTGRLVALNDGSVIGRGEKTTLWRYETSSGSLDKSFGTLPDANWDGATIWAKDPVTGLVFTADAESNLYSFSLDDGWSGPLAKVPYAPVTSMAVTFDGRVFGSAGTDMQRVFCFDPETKSVTDIGVAASTFQQRRYCYEYGDAVTGRDGEIVFGERDDLGHLFLYYPRIKNTRK
jgi:hypothetical protein